MLTEIRDRSTGWFAWGLALLIIIPMAFWGIQDYASGDVDPAVVSVGDSNITQREFQAALQNQQQRFRQQFGQNINDSFLNSPDFKQNVLQGIMQQRAIQHIAERGVYSVGDSQLVELIKQNPVFQEEGQFSQDAFNRYAAQSGFARQQFEENIREQAVLQQVTSGYRESSFVLPEETREVLEWQVEERDFELLTIDSAQFREKVEISDEDLQQYYADNVSSLLKEASTSIQYVELDAEAFKQDLEVNEDNLLALYEENKEALRSNEVRETRHILISLDEGEDKALEKANELKERLGKGEDFATLAKEFSQDPGSANNGGSLGKVQKGQMVAEFEEVNFSIEQGVVSDPVKSQFGYHLIKVDDIQLPAQKTFEEVRSDLEQQELDRLAQDILIEKEERLRNLAYEFPESLETVAEELSLELKTTETFTQANGAGIAANPSVRQVAFSEEVSVDRLNSEPINVSDTKIVVLRTLEFTPEAPFEFEEVKDRVTESVTATKADELANEKISALAELAKTEWESAKTDETTELSEHKTTVSDQASGLEQAVLREAFSMTLDDPIRSLEGNGGKSYLIKLNTVVAGDVADASDSIKQQTQALLTQRSGNTFFSDYLDNYIESIASEINADLL